MRWVFIGICIFTSEKADVQRDGRSERPGLKRRKSVLEARSLP